MFALRRLFRASKENTFGEWKAKTLLLIVDVNILTNVSLTVFSKQLERLDPLIFGLAIAVPVALTNEYLFSRKNQCMRYCRRFASMARGNRIIADACVSVLVVGSFLLPFVIRTLTTDRAWWE